MYLDGIYLPQDTDKARELYRRAAEQGDPIGETQTGWLYVHLPPVDYQKGMAWYLKAVDGGSLIAANNIGYLYERGLGVTENKAKALDWYCRAALGGENHLFYHIGQFYENGWVVAKNPELALQNMQQAGALGDEEALIWLRAHNAVPKKLAGPLTCKVTV